MIIRIPDPEKIKNVSKITLLDIVKGLLFVLGMIIAYYLIPVVYALFFMLLHKLLNIPFVPIIIISVVIIGFIIAFSEVVTVGFPLHVLFRSKKGKGPNDQVVHDPEQKDTDIGSGTASDIDSSHKPS